jgi:hypothetical protein
MVLYQAVRDADELGLMALYQAVRDADELVSEAAHGLKTVNDTGDDRGQSEGRGQLADRGGPERTTRGECEGSRVRGSL